MEVDTQSSGNDDCMSASELKEEQEELEVAIADDAETGTSGPTETLEGWKQVHTQLIDAILVAKEAVAAKKLQRRYWMEEICSNLTPETGKLTATSIWKQPVASKDRVKQKKTAVAKKRKRSTEPKAKKTTEKKKKATANKRKSSTRDDEGEAEGEEGENKEDGVKKEKSEEKPPPKKKKKKLTKKESRGGAERNLQDTPDHETPAMFDMKNKGRDGKDKTSAADAETKEEREDMTPTKKKKASTEGATNDSSFPKADLSPMSSAASASSHPPPAILQSHHEYGTMAQQHWPSHPPPPHRAPYMVSFKTLHHCFLAFFLYISTSLNTFPGCPYYLATWWIWKSSCSLSSSSCCTTSPSPLYAATRNARSPICSCCILSIWRSILSYSTQ